MSLEYMCSKCEVRLDPHMTKEEATYFLNGGCPLCHTNSWVLVEGTYSEWFKNSNVVVLVEEEGDEENEERER